MLEFFVPFSWSTVYQQGLLTAVLCGGGAFLFTTFALKPLIGWLRRQTLLDIPNDRSSHSDPVPRGGGLVVTGAVILGWSVVFAQTGRLSLPMGLLLLCAMGLGALSWWDDREDVSAKHRLAAHCIAVLTCLAVLPTSMTVSGGLLPLWIERGVLFFAWIWFLNLYNFMDGIDGLTGCETMHVGVGVALVGGIVNWPFLGLGAVLVGCGAGFLIWNWHPAKIFLGDVGSVPLGFLIGGVLIALAGTGHGSAAVLLPAYSVADASITLIRRLWGGHAPTAAHREHFYQKAVRRGLSHAQVVRRIILCNALLLVAALSTEISLLFAWLLAMATIAATLWSLHAGGKEQRCRSKKG